MKVSNINEEEALLKKSIRKGIFMKIFNILYMGACLSMICGSVFSIINTTSEKEIFPSWLLVTLFSIALVGYVSKIVVTIATSKKAKIDE